MDGEHAEAASVDNSSEKFGLKEGERWHEPLGSRLFFEGCR